MQKAKVLTQRSAVALMSDGVSPNASASDPSPQTCCASRHDGDVDEERGRALIMGNAKSQGLVLQHSTATLMSGGVSPNVSASNPSPQTCCASRHDGDGDGDGGRVLIMKNAKS